MVKKKKKKKKTHKTHQLLISYSKLMLLSPFPVDCCGDIIRFQPCEEKWKEVLMYQYSLADAMTDK